jgi:hypothetical protein
LWQLQLDTFSSGGKTVMDLKAKRQEINAKKREWLARIHEEEMAFLRSIPDEPLTIRDSRLEFTIAEGVGSIKMRIPSDPKACGWAFIDEGDLDKLALFLLYGRQRENHLQPYLSGSSNFWSLPRMLLGIDDPNYKVRYLDGNPLNNTRHNLVVCKVGLFPLLPYGGWLTVRRQARERSGGVCERCHKQPATDVHHRIPAKFFTRPADAHFLPNLVDLCEQCHKQEHLKLLQEMPLFYGAVLPAVKNVT